MCNRNMRKIVYSCNKCDKVLSDGKTKEPHIHVDFRQIGWAMPSNLNPGQWVIAGKAQGIMQFCSPQCLANFIRGIKPTKNSSKK